MKHRIQHMKQCIALGKQAMGNGDSPVGSIIVKDNAVIGIGVESGKSSNDVTKHAEIEAIKDAIANHQSLTDTILYTTHEPCIMCSYVIRHHHIKTVVFGAKSNFVGGTTSEFKVLETENVPGWKNRPKIIAGVLEDECLTLSKIYQSRQNK